MTRGLTNHRAWLCIFMLLSVASLSACRSREKTDVEVEVRSVGFDSASHSPVVVLQDHDRKVALPIWIGPAEAQSIAMEIQGINPPRPMTHDLIKSILDGAGVELQKVMIQDLKESTYYARIYLRASGHDVQVDSRPSDAIALAVRFHRPIFVAAALMQGDATIDLLHEAPGGSTVKYSGVTVQNLTRELADYFSLPPGTGVLVAEIEGQGSDGLQRGDVILEVNGDVVSGVGDFRSKMQAVKRGTNARLSVQRGSERVHAALAAQAD